jgi:general secretion pathway protein K
MMHQHNQQHRKKRGGALISALFIMALAAIIATALAVEEQLLIHEGGLAMNADHAYLALQNAQDRAEIAIENYAAQWPIGSQAPVTSQIKPLESPLKTIEISGLSLTTRLESAQGRFNINDLAYPQNQQNFSLLLKTVFSTITQAQADQISQSMTAWIMTGGDDAYYLSLNPAYRAAKNQFVSTSELRLVRGITPDIYTALAPYVTALPIVMPQLSAPTQQAVLTQIDINAATVPVLMAVNPGLNPTQAESMVDCRKATGAFLSVQTFITNCAIPSGISNLQHVTAQSQYYLVEATTPTNHTILAMNSLMMTQVTKDNKLKVISVWQSFE